MQYPIMNKQREFQKAIYGLNGGMNCREAPEYIADTQLSYCENVYYTGSVLRTRPPLCLHGNIHSGVSPADVVCVYVTEDRANTIVVTKTEIHIYDRAGNKSEQYIGNNLGFTIENAFFAEIGREVLTDYDVTTPAVYMYARVKKDGEVQNRIFRWLTRAKKKRFLEIDPNTYYVPTRYISGVPSPDMWSISSAVTPNEGYSLLTDKFQSTWDTDGEGKYYTFPDRIDPSKQIYFYISDDGGVQHRLGFLQAPSEDGRYQDVQTWECGQKGNWNDAKVAKICNVSYTELTLEYTPYHNCLYVSGMIANESEKRNIVALPDQGYSGNVLIEAHRAGWSERDADKVFKNKFATWFADHTGVRGGSQLFVAGNPDEPEVVRYSDVGQPTYFSENGFFGVGSAATAVTGFGRQQSSLVIFKPRETWMVGYVYVGVDKEALAAGEAVDSTQDAYFPLSILHPTIGCDRPRTIQFCGNRLVWACSDGHVYTLSSLSAYSDRSVRNISYAIEPELGAIGENASATLWRDNYVLQTDNALYLFDYSASGFVYFSSYYDDKKAGNRIPWYKWTMKEPLRSLEDYNAKVSGDKWRSTVPERLWFVSGDDRRLLVFCTATLGDNTEYILCRSISEESDDERYEGAVPFSLTTKAFSFDRPNERKMVTGMFLESGGSRDGAEVWVSYLPDGRETDTEAQPIRLLPDTVGERFSVTKLPCREERVRTIAMRLSGVGDAAFSGFTWLFRPIGPMR